MAVPAEYNREKEEKRVKLFGFWRSIATYRVRLALALKELEFEEVSVDLLEGHQHRAEFLAINPAGAVPALLVDGLVLTQSSAIIEYLEERFPTYPLLPGTPEDRAFARAIAMDTIADAHPLIVPRVRGYLAATFGADDAAINAWSRKWLTHTLETYDQRLSQRTATPFVFGEKPGYADIAVKSHAVACALFGIDVGRFPHVDRLSAAMDKVPGLADLHPLKVRAGMN